MDSMFEIRFMSSPFRSEPVSCLPVITNRRRRKFLDASVKVTGMPSGAVIHWNESFVRSADELEWSAECQAGRYLKAVPGLWVYTAIGLGLAVYIRAAARGTAGSLVTWLRSAALTSMCSVDPDVPRCAIRAS